MIKINEYVGDSGKSAFALWFESLDAKSATKVTTALTRMETVISPMLKEWGIRIRHKLWTRIQNLHGQG